MNKSTIISLILVIVFMGVIFLLSDMNEYDSNGSSKGFVIKVVNIYDQLTNADEETRNYHSQESFIDSVNTIIRKICHVTAYLIIYILSFNLVTRIFKSKLYIYNVICISFCFLYAIIDEFHQTFVDGRVGSIVDVFIDGIGILIGCFIMQIIYQKKHKN